MQAGNSKQIPYSVGGVNQGQGTVGLVSYPHTNRRRVMC